MDLGGGSKFFVTTEDDENVLNSVALGLRGFKNCPNLLDVIYRLNT